MLQERDTSLWEAVKNRAKDVAGKIRAIVDAYKDERMDSREGKVVANMKEILPQLEELYAEGLADSRGEAVTDSDAGPKKAAQDGGVKYHARGTGKEVVSIKEQLANASTVLDNMEPVASIDTVDLSKMTQNQRYKWAVNILKPSGYKVDRKEFGIIEFTEKQINTGLNYLDSPGEIAALAALPKVLKRGEIIFENDNHKFRNFGSVTIAAPIIVNGIRGSMAVVVQKTTSNHYHTHRVLMPDGSSLEFKRNAAPKPSGDLTINARRATTISAASDNMLTQTDSGVKHSDRDSNGTQLSKEQVDFFRNSKARDEDGNLLVMYHGTPNGGFTKFRSGSYFTQNPEYAALYQNPGASMLRQKKGADSPQNYQVYLNIEKPFDTRNPKERKIFMQEYYHKYGTGAPLSDSGLPDWTNGMDLQEFIEDMGYDYDGLILDEGATGGYGEEVKSRGLSYVTFNPEQVKDVKNTTPTANPDYRFSDRDPDAVKVNHLLQKQNAELRETVGCLKALVRLQGKVTGGTVYFDIAEIALSALGRQYIANNRISDLPSLRSLLEPWAVARNFAQKGVDWHFTTDDARTKLKHLYPIIKI